MKVIQSKLIIIPIAFVALILAGIIVVPTMLATSAEPTIDEAKIEQGVQVYLDAYCGACHVLDIAQTRGTFGPAHNTMGTLALDRINSEAYIGESNTAEDYIRESILDPQAFLVPEYIASSHAMPAFTHLLDEDLDVLVYMLVHQVGATE